MTSPEPSRGFLIQLYRPLRARTQLLCCDILGLLVEGIRAAAFCLFVFAVYAAGQGFVTTELGEFLAIAPSPEDTARLLSAFWSVVLGLAAAFAGIVGLLWFVKQGIPLDPEHIRALHRLAEGLDEHQVIRRYLTLARRARGSSTLFIGDLTVIELTLSRSTFLVRLLSH